MATPYITPLESKRLVFQINNNLISRRYIVISDELESSTVSLQISGCGSFIYDDQYLLIKVDKNNLNKYPLSNNGDNVVSWLYDDVNNDDIYNATIDRFDQFIEIDYIHVIPEEIEIPVDDTDEVDWANN
jgi:hypothetical protein